MHVILLTSSGKSCSALIHFVNCYHITSRNYGEDTIFISPSMLNHRSHKQCSQQLRVGKALAVM